MGWLRQFAFYVLLLSLLPLVTCRGVCDSAQCKHVAEPMCCKCMCHGVAEADAEYEAMQHHHGTHHYHQLVGVRDVRSVRLKQPVCAVVSLNQYDALPPSEQIVAQQLVMHAEQLWGIPPMPLSMPMLS